MPANPVGRFLHFKAKANSSFPQVEAKMALVGRRQRRHHY